MLTLQPRKMREAKTGAQRGAALVEILVSILIVSFGLLALAGLQTKMNMALMESYQRAQALTLVRDLTQRMQANLNQDTSYVTAANTALGTGDAQPADCSTIGPSADRQAKVDLCEWSNALKGAAEKNAADANVGAMLGARGCVEQLQAVNAATGICLPATYRITIAWQGLNSTVVPAVNCAANSYGADDSLRKVVSSRVVIPLPACS